MATRVVDADELERLAAATSRARDEIATALWLLETGQGIVPWDRDTRALWDGIRSRIRRERDALDDDADRLRDRARRVRMMEAERALCQAIDALWALIRGSGQALASLTEGLVVGAQDGFRRATATVAAVVRQMSSASDFAENSVPKGTFRDVHFKSLIILPAGAFGLPTSVQVEYKVKVQMRRLPNGDVEVVIDKEYDAAAVQKLTPGARASLGLIEVEEGLQASASEGGVLRRHRRFVFSDREDLEKILVYGAAFLPDENVLDTLAATIARDDLRENLWSTGARVTIRGSAAGIAEAELDTSASLISGDRVTDAGLHESVVGTEFNVEGSVRFLEASGSAEVDATVSRVLVKETGRSYTEVTFHVESRTTGELVSLKQVLPAEAEKLGLQVGSHRELEIAVQIDDGDARTRDLLARGDFAGLLNDPQRRSHMVITAVDTGEDYGTKLEGEVTPLPTQTFGASVDVSTGSSDQRVVFDNGYELRAHSTGAGGGAW